MVSEERKLKHMSRSYYIQSLNRNKKYYSFCLLLFLVIAQPSLTISSLTHSEFSPVPGIRCVKTEVHTADFSGI